MSDRPTVTPHLPALLDEPGSIAEALDTHLHLTALEGWAGDLKKYVAGWINTQAEERKAVDGAAPTWRLPDGQVLLTDPQPKPTISDRDRFARWYVVTVLGRDAEERPEPPGDVLWFDDHVAVRLVATVDSPHLVRFLADEAFAGEDTEQRAGAAARLAAQARVEEQWLAGDAVLEGLIDGTIHGRASGGRVVVDTDRLLPYDRDTGEIVPGVEVRPGGAPVVQVRPSTKAKQRVRGELDDLIGTPPPVEG